MNSFGKQSRRVAGPAGLAAITVLGLLSALIGEGGVWWLVSWAALAVPAAMSVCYGIRGCMS
jgi:hypothetical protein